jgi:hypothetical protein
MGKKLQSLRSIKILVKKSYSLISITLSEKFRLQFLQAGDKSELRADIVSSSLLRLDLFTSM